MAELLLTRNIVHLRAKLKNLEEILPKLVQYKIISDEEALTINDSGIDPNKNGKLIAILIKKDIDEDIDLFIEILYITGNEASARLLSRQLHKIDNPSTVTVMQIRENDVIVLRNGFENLLNKIGKRKFVIISIIGEIGSGKSLLMSCFLQYLDSGRFSRWSEGLGGNSVRRKWDGRRSSSRGRRNGVFVWSQPFFLKNEDKEEVAILLMDSECDSNTSSREMSLIFAFSSFLSSVLVFNLGEMVSENTTKSFLDFLTEAVTEGYNIDRYGESIPIPPGFQNIIFAKRDSNEISLQHGIYYDNNSPEFVFNENDEFIQTVVPHFSSVGKVDLPRPTSEASLNSDIFNMSISFEGSTTKLMEHIFSPTGRPLKEHFPKTIEGKAIVALQYIPYFKYLAEAIKREEIPKMQHFLNNVPEEELLLFIQRELHKFKREMNAFLSRNKTTPNSKLKHESNKMKSGALRAFNNYEPRTFVKADYATILEANIDSAFSEIGINNDKRLQEQNARKRKIYCGVLLAVVFIILVISVVVYSLIYLT